MLDIKTIFSQRDEVWCKKEPINATDRWKNQLIKAIDIWKNVCQWHIKEPSHATVTDTWQNKMPLTHERTN